MKVQRTFTRLALFAALGFGPLLILYLLVALGLLVGGVLLPALSSSHRFASGVAAFTYCAISIIVPGLFVFFAYYLSTSLRSWIIRAVILYVTLLILGTGLVYVFTSAIAGMSMAVVDGVTKGEELRNQIGRETVSMLLPAQLCLVPWCIFALFLLRRFGKHVFLEEHLERDKRAA